jgi:hypothetical protein
MSNKMRLIDADKLMKRFRIVAQSGGPVMCHVSDICATIEDEAAEESVDAVEVVRCKDCKRYEENTEARTRFCRRELGYMYATPDGFCSYGERKDK